MLFVTTPYMSTATEFIRFPNTLSSVTCSRGWIQFSSNRSGSSKSFGWWNFSIAPWTEVKSSTSTKCFLKLFVETKRISSWKFFAFSIVAYKQKISTASNLKVTVLLRVFWFVWDQIAHARLDTRSVIQFLRSLCSLRKQSDETEHC